jgi:hypothetical protein
MSKKKKKGRKKTTMLGPLFRKGAVPSEKFEKALEAVGESAGMVIEEKAQKRSSSGEECNVSAFDPRNIATKMEAAIGRFSSLIQHIARQLFQASLVLKHSGRPNAHGSDWKEIENERRRRRK